jgi:hypothetical protein
MKKLITFCIVCLFFIQVNAQIKPDVASLKARANDHFMLQFTGDTWSGQPDSILKKGIGRGANVYFMMDYPFKTNRHLSVGIGAGFGTSNIYFKNTNIGIAGTTTNILFTKTDSVNHFKKYKMTTAFLEIPVELRWVQNQDKSDKSFKAALGVKVGTLITAYTKGKEVLDKNGLSINKYTEKIKSNKRYLNTSRIALTARVGWGHFSVFGQYQVTGVFKENIGPDVKPYSIGIALSGL